MKIALLIIIAVLIILSIVAYRAGFFHPVKVTKQKVGPYKIVYEEHLGPYKETGKIQDRIYAELKQHNIATSRGIGIYYDNPKDTPAEECRSKVGCILA